MANKRSYAAAFNSIKTSKRGKRIARGSKGFVRTGGYFGRFSGRRSFRRGQRVERKFFDIINGGTVMAAAGTVVNSSLNLVTQGNKENQMIGRKITVRSIEMKFHLLKPADSDGSMAGNVSADNYRIMLIQDKQCNGAAATVAQVLEQANIFGLRELENTARFKILKEWCGSMNGVTFWDGTNYISNQVIKYVRFFKRVRIDIEFAQEASAGTRAITEIKSNNIFLIGLTELGVISYLGNVRLRYTDV